MQKIKKGKGFTLIEMIVAVAIFGLFALAVYESFRMLLKAVYGSRIKILETALLDEKLEIARNLVYNDIGILNGAPPGLLPHTTTTYRNGVAFLVTTAVRSIDDPFDGTITSIPKDTAPADYKLVEINAKCTSCERPIEATVSTIIAPRDLEGASNNGALFVYVTDSNSKPLKGVNVHIENTTTANVVIDDVTDKDGYLKIVDTPTGTLNYAVTVSKPGYSTDGTVASSTDNPNPVNRQLTVSTQQVTESFFSIDLLGSLTAHTVNESCEVVGDANFLMKGAKLIGTPDVRKFSKNLQSDASGVLDVNNLEFDIYDFDFAGTGYDLAGSIPIVPVDLPAGGHKDVTLILAPHVANTLLVKVLDNANKQPLSDATIKLTKAGYSATQKTNFGNLSQTDWSGLANPGQIYNSDSAPTQYEADDGKVDVSTSVGNIMLGHLGPSYYTEGSLESSIFDIGKKVDFKELLFSSISQPPETGNRSILLQLAMSNSSTMDSLLDFKGPDGTNGTYYSPTSTIVNTGGKSYRYFRYRVFLSTLDNNFTPALSDVTLTFTSGCTAPGQVFFSGMGVGAYSLDISRSGYDTTTIPLNINGWTTSTIYLHQTI